MMQIQARPFTSEAEYQREAKARTRRLWAPRNAKQDVSGVVVQFVEHARPRAPIREEQVEHVRAWEAWMLAPGNGVAPLDNIKARCRQQGVRVSVLRSPKRDRPLFEFRHDLIREVAERYPYLSSPQIGRLFRRDHSSVLFVLGRLTSKEDQLKRALAGRIAREELKAIKAAKEKFRKKRALRYNLAGIAEDYYAGLPIEAICEHHGIARRTIAGIRKRYGWPARPRTQ